MNYISTPLSCEENDKSLEIRRDLEERTQMIDNLVDQIVFTPRGSFDADPDFGFEYWNHEYANVHYSNFNNDHTGLTRDGLSSEITRQECEESIINSLHAYEPGLVNVQVRIELKYDEQEKFWKKRIASKFAVLITVEGEIDDGLGISAHYQKRVTFLMEPTVKKYRI